MTLKNHCVLSNEINSEIISLEDWSCIFFRGLDVKKYLQHQLTINVLLLDKSHHAISAQCNRYGKVCSVNRIFFDQKGMVCIVRTSLLKESLEHFKKYSIFSKVNIFIDNNFVLLAASELNSKMILQDWGLSIPNIYKTVVCNSDISILWFGLPRNHFLLLIPLSLAADFQKKYCIKVIDNINWCYLNFMSGFPIFDKGMEYKLTPYAINLDFLKGIDFNKGCYLGQENIAKIYFRKKNYKKMYWLIGKNNNNLEVVGGILSIKDKKNVFYDIGIVLSVIKINYKILWIQAILNINLNINCEIYVNHDLSSPFFINPSIFYNCVI
ncbi:MAG: tRNA-modifying protein YgfZ [Buchnera aphidicola (Eriosoma harunire)]